MTTWLELSTRKDLETYLEFWKELNPFERRIHVYNNVFYMGTGTIGKIFGATDIEDKWVGICGVDCGPVYCPKSNSIYEKLQDIDDRWKRKVEQRIGDLGTRTLGESGTTKRWLHEIEFGFQWLLQDILFGNGGYHDIGFPATQERIERHKEEERERRKQVALLYLNVPKLERSVLEWLDKNRAN